MNKKMWVLMFLFGLVTGSLQAQAKDNEKSKFGLVFMESGNTLTLLSPAIGAIWQPSNSIAVSPFINFDHDWQDPYSIVIPEYTSGPNNSTIFDVGAKLQLYLKNWNKTRLYVAPAYEFARHRSENRSTSTTSISLRDNKTNYHLVSGLWGIQYSISNRISLFGDMGVAYRDVKSSYTTTDDSTGTVDTSSSLPRHSHGVGFVNSIGLIFYLK